MKRGTLPAPPYRKQPARIAFVKVLGPNCGAHAALARKELLVLSRECDRSVRRSPLSRIIKPSAKILSLTTILPHAELHSHHFKASSTRGFNRSFTLSHIAEYLAWKARRSPHAAGLHIGKGTSSAKLVK